MKKIFLCASLFLAGALPGLAQSTTVSGTITDANSQAFANGTYKIEFNANGVTPPYVWNGSPYTPTSFSGSMNSSGAFSGVSVPSTNFISGGSQGTTLWRFTVCPASTSPCFSTSLALAGATQSVTSSITPPAIQVTSGGSITAYGDSEVVGAVVGSTYFNLTDNTTHTCTVSIPCTWVSGGGTGSGTVTIVTCVTGCTVANGTTTPAITVTATGTGNVVGPGSSTTSDAAIFGDTTGKLLADGGGPLPATKANVTNQWLNTYTLTTGLFTSSQPGFSNLSGTCAISQGCTGSATAAQNSVFAGPATGGTGAPSFQTAPTFSAANLTSFPTFNQNTSGTAAGLSATLVIASGGTNATSAAAARINMFPTASEVGDLVYCATFSSGCTSWALLPGNTSGTQFLQETSAGAPSWTTPSGSGTVTGTGTASTPTEFSSSSVIKNGVLADFETFGLLNNCMTTLGDVIYGGASGVCTRLPPATTPNGVPQILTDIPSGSAAVAETWALPGVVTRAVTGTTSTDTVVSDDCNPGRVAYQGSVAVATALPTATTLAVPNCVFRLTNTTSGSATAVTVTPTTWTINGGATLTIAQGRSCTIYVDPAGTSWDADCADLPIVAGTNITITRGQFGPTVAASGGGSNAYPITVSGTVTSGGIPYFSSTTVQTSSALFPTGDFVLGGGAGGAPTATFSVVPIANGGTGAATVAADTVFGNPTGSTAAPSFTTNPVVTTVTLAGTTATFMDYAQGTTSAAVAPCNTATSICEQAPTTVTAYLVNKPGVSANGVETNNVASAVDTQGFSGDANHSNGATGTSISTATSIGSTSLCSTANCPAGTYQINGYIDVTTACTTTGSYFVTIGYTDDAGAKTIVMPLIGTGVTASILTATGISSSLAMSSTSNFAQGDLFIRSTGAAAINYTTTAGACATGGPGLGKMYLSVIPVQ